MRQYHELLQYIISHGQRKEQARDGMPSTLSIFGYQSRYNLSEGFPLITTKKMFWKGIVAELLWFLRGDVNIKYLDENGVRKLWHQDSFNFLTNHFFKGGNTLPGISNDLTFDEYCTIITETPRNLLPSQNGYTLGDCGYQYGKVWRSWANGEEKPIDQIAKVITGIQRNPMGRRHIVTAIDPVNDQNLALYWCHAMFQFNCRQVDLSTRVGMYVQRLKADPSADREVEILFNDNDITQKNKCDVAGIPEYYVDLHLFQRSADVVLGVGFNISSYSLLTHMVAKLCNMIPGEFVHTLSDAHIYDNHINAAQEQLARDYNKYPLPELKFSSTIDWDYIKSTLDFSKLTVDEIQLEGYQSYPAIVAPLSTGLKK